MSKLTDPLILPCGQSIKNRICKAAMTERIAKGNNLAHQGHINLYRKWAEGNIGLLLTGNVMVDRKNMEGPANVVINSQNYKDHIDELKNWSSAGTEDNTQLWMQISHAGRQTPGEINSSPSNGLENFDFDEETPELFNSDGLTNESNDETSSMSQLSESKEEEDDLEIPAFLRRQKN